MLSVLIVNWNTKDLLHACLASIARFPPQSEFEIIVVDNASADGSAEMVREEFPNVRLLARDLNEGYARGNNLACAAASGDFLLTLNPDTEMLDDALQKSLDILSQHPACGALAPRLIGVDGQPQRSVRGFPSVRGIIGDLTSLGRILPGGRLDSYRLSAFDYDREQTAPQPMGTYLLFRRSALESVGDPLAPFDERFPIFFNEVDLLLRLDRAGWQCLYTPQVRVLHHGGESTRQVRKSMIWESHKSLVRFFRKHHRTRWNALGLVLFGGLIYTAAFVRAKGYHAGFRS